MRKVLYARLQTNAFVPGAAELGNTLPPPTKTLDNLTMGLGVEGLYVSFVYRSLKKELVIPYANVSLMEVAPEEPKVKAVK